MATLTAATAVGVGDDLKPLYRFRDVKAVDRFLSTHPTLVPLLREARPVIDHWFPAGTTVGVEVFHDHEAEDEDDAELFALIQTDLLPEEAMPRLDRFFRDWWLANIGRAGCRLSFGLWYL